MKVSLDLTNLYELAKAEEEKRSKEEFCTYFDDRSYTKCGCYTVKNTGYCDKHAGKDINMGTCIEFLKVLVDNPVKLLSFVQSGSFFSTHHHVIECQLHEHKDCEDCYSGDTEHAENDALVSACKDIFQLMPKPIHDNTDAEDESEE